MLIQFPVEFVRMLETRQNDEFDAFANAVVDFGLFYGYIQNGGSPVLKKIDESKLLRVAKALKVSYRGGSADGALEAFKDGKKLYDSAERHDILVSISADLLFDMRDKWDCQSNVYQDSFIANLAVRSILGKSKYKPISAPLILARMQGWPSLRNHESEVDRSRIFNTYTKRYHLDKLINTLQTYWGIKYDVIKRRVRIFGVCDAEEFKAAISQLEQLPI